MKQNDSASSILPIKTEHTVDGFPEETSDNQVFDSGKINAERVKFKIDFERSHPDFFERQKNQHDNLTNNEAWLLAYFHLKLSTKEIAVLLNIDSGSVRRAKTRLQKKLGSKVAG